MKNPSLFALLFIPFCLFVSSARAVVIENKRAVGVNYIIYSDNEDLATVFASQETVPAYKRGYVGANESASWVVDENLLFPKNVTIFVQDSTRSDIESIVRCEPSSIPNEGSNVVISGTPSSHPRCAMVP